MKTFGRTLSCMDKTKGLGRRIRQRHVGLFWLSYCCSRLRNKEHDVSTPTDKKLTVVRNKCFKMIARPKSRETLTNMYIFPCLSIPATEEMEDLRTVVSIAINGDKFCKMQNDCIIQDKLTIHITNRFWSRFEISQYCMEGRK